MSTRSYESVSTPSRVELISFSGSDKTVVNSARVSLASLEEMEKRNTLTEDLTDRDIKLIKYLATHKHMSPFEHCHITFWVEAPLYISKQHMRHRTWSYNEVSRRYTSEGLRIYEPRMFRQQAKRNLQASTNEESDPIVKVISGEVAQHGTHASELISDAHRNSVHAYHTLLDAGVCREQARGVLPNSLMTQYYATVNLRNLLGFLRERLADNAQYEIRHLARQMAECAKSIFPVSYTALMESDDV